MRILGINCMNHDAAMAVVDGTEILWAAHAERYSKVKNDHYLNWAIVNEESQNFEYDITLEDWEKALDKAKRFFRIK